MSRVRMDLSSISEQQKAGLNNKILKEVSEVLNNHSQNAAIISFFKDNEDYSYYIGQCADLYVLSGKSSRSAIDCIAKTDIHKAMLTLLSIRNMLDSIENVKFENEKTNEKLQMIKASVSILLDEIRVSVKEGGQN